MQELSTVFRAVAALVLVLALGACAPVIRAHGYVPTEAELASLVIGTDTRDSVTEKIGRPTASGLLADGAWYYVESKFRHWAYQAPREIERQVVAVSFDARGRVSNVERFGLEDGRVVTLSRRVTETSGARMPLLQRLFGSLGAAPAAPGLVN